MTGTSFEPVVIGRADQGTQVLLVQAPYPGKLKFDGQPTSLLFAATPLVRGMARCGRLGEVGFLDPGSASESFYGELEALARSGSLRLACISSTTAAIEEASRVARILRAGSVDLLIVAGGPHEDDCAEPMACRIPEVDISIGGDAEGPLESLALAHLDTGGRAEATVSRMPEFLQALPLIGRGHVASKALGRRPFAFGEGGHIDDLLLRPWVEREVHFDVFPGRSTLPLMLSRGCSYGRCTFCAEAISGGQRTTPAFTPLVTLLEAFPGAAVYFQDSIFPTSRAVREEVLPVLRDAARPWGCQVYLPTLSRSLPALLAAHGCTYAYTGIESGSEELRATVGKRALRDGIVSERLMWLADAGIRVGISLMFGVMDLAGRLLETERTIDETLAFVHRIVAEGVPVAGFYPNVMTVLPGTVLARGLEDAGYRLDYFRMPRVPEFEDLEDGGVGYNFASIPGVAHGRDAIVERVREAAREIEAMRERAPEGSRGTELVE